MPVKAIRFILMGVLIVLAVGTLSATDVLVPGENPPERVVLVRKLAMRSNVAHLGSLSARLESGELAEASAEALGLASVATFLPTVFVETYEEVYPVEGSNFFFRGGDTEAIVAGATELNAAAERVLALADEAGRLGAAAVDQAELQEAVSAVQGACGSCHAQFRGQM